MNTQTIKTTVEIDAELLHTAKQHALDHRTNLKTVIHQSLEQYLQAPPTTKPTPQIGGHKLGGIKGNLSRTDIYAEL